MPDTMAPLDRVRVTPVAVGCRTLLRGDPAAFGLTLPTTPCTALDGEPAALWLGPDEWLLLSQIAPTLPDDSAAGVAFDVTDRQLAWEIAGPGAAAAIEGACPLDLRTLPPGGCTRTVFGKAEILLWRRADDRFHLETWRSFAPYVTALLKQTAQIQSSPPGSTRGSTAPQARP